jgi:hypothetical protein
MFDIAQALRNKGWQGKFMLHEMGWFGDGNPQHYHPGVAYNSADPSLVSRKFDMWQLSGVAGPIMTWQGPQSYSHKSAMLESAEATRRGMKFGLLLDPWVYKGQSDPLKAIMSALTHPETVSMLNAPSYLQNKWVFDFIGKSVPDPMHPGKFITLDWAAIGAAAGVTILSRHTGYSWPEMVDAKGNLLSESAAIDVLAQQNANPLMKVPGLCPRFFDGGWMKTDGSVDFTAQTWTPPAGPGVGPVRYRYDGSGKYWFDQVDVTPLNAEIVAGVTSNDANEGTALEAYLSMMTGVDLRVRIAVLIANLGAVPREGGVSSKC